MLIQFWFLNCQNESRQLDIASFCPWFVCLCGPTFGLGTHASNRIEVL